MQAPRPAKILRGANTRRKAAAPHPSLTPVWPAETLGPKDLSKASTATQKYSSASNPKDLISQLKADNDRLESVIQQRESMHANELQRIRTETESKVRAEIEATVQQWTKVIDRLVHERERLYTEAERDVVTLSIAVAQRILAEAVQIDENAVLMVVRQALDTVREEKKVRIHMHPEDLNTVREHEEEWIKRVGARQLSFQPDLHVERGGCLIETENGEVDARIQQQLDALEEALVGKKS